MPIICAMTGVRSFGGIGSVAGGAGLDVDEVFGNFVYTGSGSARNITNGIDLSNEGGLVWIKNRDSSDNCLFDTERGNAIFFSSNLNGGGTNIGSQAYQYNSNGFGFLNSNIDNPRWNANSNTYVSWTFRKAPKFFDVVQYNGSSTAQNVPHNLGSVPGMIIVKQTNSSYDWKVYHRSVGNTREIELNQTAGSYINSSWDNTTPTDTYFRLANVGGVNALGNTYIAYLFAHNDGDGGFGPNSDQDIIKCGSYTGNGSSTGPTVNLGFEPQFIMYKNTSGTGNWQIHDVMRGIPTGSNDAIVYANKNWAENLNNDWLDVNATGFQIKNSGSDANTNGETYIYMAIRRGPLAEPESASDVFAIDTRSSSEGEGKYTSGFPVDFSLANNYDSTGNTFAGTRLINRHLQTNSSVDSSSSVADYEWDHNDGLSIGASGAFFGSSKNIINYMWKRAPGFCDVVHYVGNGGYLVVNHNLGVAPEMIWMKRHDSSGDWGVYFKSGSTEAALLLNSANAKYPSGIAFTSTSTYFSPYNSDFPMQNSINGAKYISYLFASLDGVSKLGSYTGNGSSQTIDCGFTNGARFVLIKCTSQNSCPWLLFDSERGITTGVDPHLRIDSTDAQASQAANDIEPDNSGFILDGVNNTNNGNGESYIFYAIA